ncbi:hypothetical protein RYX36_012227, partial [Vicia faba]
KQLQHEFLDHGVLTLLNNWLEPLPNGSLPNINIRTNFLKILNDFPIDLEQFDRREQLKRSGLRKVGFLIMFLSRSDEEINVNRKLAKDLVDKWVTRRYYMTLASTQLEDMRNIKDDRAPYTRPLVKKPVNKAAWMESRDGDLDLDPSHFTSGFTDFWMAGQSSSRQHASRPEATHLDFVIRPQSKIDPDGIRARAKQALSCEPPLNDIGELVDKLNNIGGLFKFVKAMRKRFQQILVPVDWCGTNKESSALRGETW